MYETHTLPVSYQTSWLVQVSEGLEVGLERGTSESRSLALRNQSS